MKYNTKYSAIKVDFFRNQNDQKVEVNLELGNIEGPYYSQSYPQEYYDTQKEAIEAAYKKSKYVNWMIVPIILFDIFED